jgi:predicted nucleotidyltransferase/uncharacterized protein with HEPN domain
MRTEDRDPALLFTMVDSARHAQKFTAGIDLDGFASDRTALSATEMVLGTMGRAAARVSAATRMAAPEVEWARMEEFAEYLVREYRSVTPQQVWTEVHETVPVVIRAIEPLIPAVPFGESADPLVRKAAPRLEPPPEQIAEFCRKWRVDEMALFGSVLRDDFRPDSDVDVLLEFAPDAGVSLFDYTEMQDDLEAIFGRRVDVVNKRGIREGRNPFSQKEILGTAHVIYALEEQAK